jgi:hypothetical protein
VIIAIAFFPIIGIISWDPLEGDQYNGGAIFVPYEEEINYDYTHDNDYSPSDDYIPIIPREDTDFHTESVPIILSDSYPSGYFDNPTNYEQPAPQYGEIAPIEDVGPGQRGRSSFSHYMMGRKDEEDDWGLDKSDFYDDDHGHGHGWGWGGISHADAFGYSDRFYGLKSWKVQKGPIFDRTKKKFAYRPGNWDYFAAPNYQVHKYARHPLDKHESKKYQHPLEKYDYGWGSGYDFTKGKYYKLKEALSKIHFTHHNHGW